PWVFLALVGAVHLAYVFHHRVNADETQHLHVAWEIGQGLLPYRDVFDNHAPLFSVLMTPVVRALGERPDIVLLARLAMIPIAVLSLAMTWMIGRQLFSARVAVWAVAMAGASPDVLFPSVEYRTDQLWAALWLSAVTVLLWGRLSPRRSFFAGTLMGAA